MLFLCAICFHVFANEERSIVTFTCGHLFHTYCIGATSNMKGEMMCPYCQKIEQVEFPPTPDRELLRNRAMFAEHMVESPQAHSHIVQDVPIPTDNSNASETVDDPKFNQCLNGQPGQNEPYNLNPFLEENVHYQSGGHHSPPVSSSTNCLDGVDHDLAPSSLRTATADAHTSFPRGTSSLNHAETWNLHYEEKRDHIPNLSDMSSDWESGWESHDDGSYPSHMYGNFGP